MIFAASGLTCGAEDTGSRKSEIQRALSGRGIRHSYTDRRAQSNGKIGLLREPDRAEIGVLHDEAQPHYPPCQSAYIAAVLPRGRAVEFIADQFLRVRERVPRERVAAVILNLDANRSRRRR